MGRLDQDYEPIMVQDGDDIGSNRSSNQPLLELARARMSRRTALKGFVTTAVMGALGGTLTSRVALAQDGPPASASRASRRPSPRHAGRPGYTAQVLIRWGDPVLPGAPAFDPMNQTADAQAKQFGYNNDFSVISRCRGARTAPSMACFMSTMSTPARSSCSRAGPSEGADADAIGEASLAAQTPEQTRDRDDGARRRGDRGDQGERRAGGW